MQNDNRVRNGGVRANGEETVYAGFFVRLCAYIVDVVLVWMFTLVVRLPLGMLSLSSPNNFLVRDLVFQYSLTDILLWLLSVTYFVVMTYNTGSTLGKKLFRLEVISSDKDYMSLFDVVYRESIGRYLSGVIYNVGYLIIGADREKRGFHDILADTRVIYTDGRHKSNAQKRWDDYYMVPRDAMGRPIPKDESTGQYQLGIPRDVETPEAGQYSTPGNTGVSGSSGYGMLGNAETQGSVGYGMQGNTETPGSGGYGMPGNAEAPDASGNGTETVPVVNDASGQQEAAGEDRMAEQGSQQSNDFLPRGEYQYFQETDENRNPDEGKEENDRTGGV